MSWKGGKEEMCFEVRLKRWQGRGEVDVQWLQIPNKMTSSFNSLRCLPWGKCVWLIKPVYPITMNNSCLVHRFKNYQDVFEGKKCSMETDVYPIAMNDSCLVRRFKNYREVFEGKKCSMETGVYPIAMNDSCLVRRFKNYREVFDGKKCSVESDGATCTLRIRNVDFTDGGDIECQARNRYGAVSIRAKLTILGRGYLRLVTLPFPTLPIFHLFFSYFYLKYLLFNFALI